MGVVYRAREISLNRPVALKVLGSRLNTPSYIARFKREAEAAAKLNHPGIASVYSIAQEDFCYIAMEYIDGVSVREVIDRLRQTSTPAESIDSCLRRREELDHLVPVRSPLAAGPPREESRLTSSARARP